MAAPRNPRPAHYYNDVYNVGDDEEEEESLRGLLAFPREKFRLILDRFQVKYKESIGKIRQS